MSFPPGTEMFQFSGFASPKLCIHFGDTFLPINSKPGSDPKIEAGLKLIGEGGFPHSEICGSKVAHTSPQLIAACHVLHRLCMPRHPPIALTSRLRIHITIDRPACITQAPICGDLVLLIRTDSTFVRTTQLDNHYVVIADR